MFGDFFKREFTWLFKRLRWFAAACLVMGALGGFMIAFDRNPVEATGTIMGYFLIVYGALGMVLGAIVFETVSLCRLFSDKQRAEAAVAKFPVAVLFAKLLAYAVCLWVPLVLLAIEVCAFLNGHLGSIFSYLAERRLQIFWEIELLAALTPLGALAIPAIVATFKNRPRKIALCVLTIIVTSIVLSSCFMVLVCGILLFEASPSTDMTSLWTVLLIALFALIAYDVGAYIIICRILKKRGTCIHENHHSDPLP